MKGIVIFLMVLGHCVEYGNPASFFPDGSAFKNIVHNVIYSFHMPLLGLVSGYLFFGQVSRYDVRAAILRKAQSLVLPIISWTIIYAALKYCTGLWGWSISNYCIHILWFLWAIFLSSCAVLAGRSFFNDSIVYYAGLLCVLLFVPTARNCIFIYPYFAAGYLFHREGLNEKLQALSFDHKLMITSCLVLIWVLLLQYYDADAYIYGTGIVIFREGRILMSQLVLDMYRWAIGFAGSLAVMAVLSLVKPVKIFAELGKYTIGIYAMSRCLDQLLPRAYGGYIMNFAEAAAILAVCYGLSVMISRVKILNQLLLGGR